MLFGLTQTSAQSLGTLVCHQFSCYSYLQLFSTNSKWLSSHTRHGSTFPLPAKNRQNVHLDVSNNRLNRLLEALRMKLYESSNDLPN